MAFAQSHDFSVNQPVMFDQSNNATVVNQFNTITNEINSGRLSPISQVPPSTTQTFTGQEVYLEALNNHFKNDENDKSRKYFLLYGMGGIGKTQICLKYKDDSEDDYEYMFWIDATSNETITQSLKDIYKSHPTVQHSAFSANAVLHWISSLKTKWLMIYDNADSAPEVVEKCLPPGNKGNILITSRNQALRRLTTIKYAMEVTEMSTDTAIMLLLRSSGLDFQYEQYKDIANDIVSELYGIPLAIAQAGAYIMHGECDITNYLDVYRKNRATLLSNEEYGGASNYKRSVYGTWELSYQQLIKVSENSNKAAVAKYAINIINISAFYHYLNIPMAIFERAAENYSSWMKEYADDIQPIFLKSMDPDLFNIDENDRWNEIIFNQAIALLLSFSLIKKDSSKYFSFHPLIQQWCQDRLHQTDRLHWILVSGGILATSITNDNSTLEAIFHQKITLHLGNIVTKLMGLQCYYDILSKFALTSKSVGSYMTAEKLAKEVVKMDEELLGEYHSDTLAWKGELSRIYLALGKMAESELLQSQLLEDHKRILGDEHPHTLTHMENLAYIFSNPGKLSEAEGLRIKVVEARKRILGDEHPHTLTSMNNLALTYSELGKLSGAEDLQIQVVEACKRILGDYHPDTLTSMNNLAYGYGKLGKWSEAETLRLEELEKRRNGWRTQHSDTLRCMTHLFEIYLKLGKVSEAKQLKFQIIDVGGRMKANDVALDENLQMWYDYVYNTSRFTEDTNQQIDLDEGEEESSSGIVKKGSKMRRFVGKFKKSMKLRK